MLRIAIQILVRDNRKYLTDYFFPYFSELERKLKKDIRFSYFFLENDSCDESHKVCIKFLRGRSGLIKTSSAGKGIHIKSASLSPAASAKMHLLAALRTQLNDLVPHDDFDLNKIASGRTILRNRIYCVLKGKIKKSTRTLTLLGVKNISQVKLHLEKQFKNGMTWKNHGKWHIDHIKPQSNFTKDQVKECFALDNLKPEWQEWNLWKSNRFIGSSEDNPVT